MITFLEKILVTKSLCEQALCLIFDCISGPEHTVAAQMTASLHAIAPQRPHPWSRTRSCSSEDSIPGPEYAVAAQMTSSLVQNKQLQLRDRIPGPEHSYSSGTASRVQTCSCSSESTSGSRSSEAMGHKARPLSKDVGPHRAC